MSNRIEHFESLFAQAPISLWEEDYSGIKHFFDELRSRGLIDLNQHFGKHPQTTPCMKRKQSIITGEGTIKAKANGIT